MRINQTTRIIGEKVILVPYRKHHVFKYHNWMAIPEIQELTASEPLSLEEEYEMQAKWQQDDDKLTFIILRRDLYENSDLTDLKEKEVNSMIGDVNCFISQDHDDDKKFIGELEIMIVDKINRSNGYGSESVYLMINYCAKYLNNPKINEFIVKIGENNEPSIKMFKKLGFIDHEYISVFKLVSLKLILSDDYFQGEKNLNNKLFKFEKNFLFNIDPNY